MFLMGARLVKGRSWGVVKVREWDWDRGQGLKYPSWGFLRLGIECEVRISGGVGLQVKKYISFPLN